MVATIGKGIQVNYYLGLTEYHLSGKEPDGVWLSAPSEFGLDYGSVVTRASFELVHNGCSPDGTQRVGGAAEKRVANFDLTLSAPKSVSLAFALGNATSRSRIERAQRKAAETVVGFLNREAAFIRRGKGGAVIHAAQLTIAAFQHAESRPALHADGRTFADPDLHTHLCIANLGRAEVTDATGSSQIIYGALDARALYAAKMAAGAVYHQALATEMQNLGYQIEVTGRNGIFELAGPGGVILPDEIKHYFSARRNMIEERLGDYQVASADAPALAAAITRGTRSAKVDQSEDRFARWRSIAEGQGLATGALEPKLNGASVLSSIDQDALIAVRVSEIPDRLTEHESVFERRHLVAAVASALVGTGASPDRVDQEVEKLVASHRVSLLGRDRYGHGLYSTPEMVAIERSLVERGGELARSRWAAVPSKTLERFGAATGLSAEQLSAAKAATSSSALTVIEGAAGAGKTTTLMVVTQAYRSRHKQVLGAATAWRTAHLLRDELGIEAFAIDSLLAQCRSGNILLNKDTVLLVDEAGQIGSRAMHAIVSLAAAAGAKLVLVGDRNQLQSIAAGPALQILAKVAEPARIETVVRQRDRFAREAAAEFSKANAARGLAGYSTRGLITAARGAREAVVAAVDAWYLEQARSPAERHLLVAKSNNMVRALNAEIRKRQRAANQLTGDEFVIQAGNASGRSYRLALAEGDRIRFGMRNDQIAGGIINGTTGVIERITGEEDGHLSIAARIEGRGATFSTRDLCDDDGRVRLTHDLATTVYASQGLTAESATVLMDANFDRHDGYVAMSRARGTTRIIVDELLLDAQIRAGRDYDGRSGPIDRQEQLTFLGARLSRSAVKSSTLDLSESSAPSLQHSSAIRTKRRTSRLEL